MKVSTQNKFSQHLISTNNIF